MEYLSNGGVAENHKDFKELRYNECLTNFSCNGKNGNSDGSITHSFQLKSAYDNNLMPYTNYTYDFKVKKCFLVLYTFVDYLLLWAFHFYSWGSNFSSSSSRSSSTSGGSSGGGGRNSSSSSSSISNSNRRGSSCSRSSSRSCSLLIITSKINA